MADERVNLMRKFDSLQMSTTARVTLTVSVPVSSTWGPGCDQQQIFDQASEEAISIIKRAVAGTDVKVIGEPVVESAIVVTKKQ